MVDYPISADRDLKYPACVLRSVVECRTPLQMIALNEEADVDFSSSSIVQRESSDRSSVRRLVIVSTGSIFRLVMISDCGFPSFHPRSGRYLVVVHLQSVDLLYHTTAFTFPLLLPLPSTEHLSASTVAFFPRCRS